MLDTAFINGRDIVMKITIEKNGIAVTFGADAFELGEVGPAFVSPIGDNIATIKNFLTEMDAIEQNGWDMILQIKSDCHIKISSF